MNIRKQEFYEGAALHVLARRGSITSIKYEAPFFKLNDRLLVYLKYCTRTRSPWGFTFTSDERRFLQKHGGGTEIVIGLICGSDGIAALTYAEFCSIASQQDIQVHVSCYRSHGEHYEVNGPDGTLGGKVAPSDWQRILER